MKLETVRTCAMALPEVTEAPHHHFGSFRVRGRIFVTIPPGQAHIHLFLAEDHREQALAMYPAFTEKLLWGGKVVGVRLHLPVARVPAVKRLVRQAWENRAPKALLTAPPESSIRNAKPGPCAASPSPAAQALHRHRSEHG